jgi:trk system potassium uptake protein TrkA
MEKKSFAVLGLGRFGMSVANTLAERGYDVLAVDIREERVNELSENVLHAIAGDATDENLLKALGIRNFDVAIVGMGDNMQASMLATVLLKDFGVPFIVAKARNELHARVLEKIGANRIVFPEKDMGIRLAHNLTTTNVIDYIELSSENSIVEVNSPAAWIGKTLKESAIRDRFGVSIIAVKKGTEVLVSPKSDYVISQDDVLVVVGSNEDIQKMQEL